MASVKKKRKVKVKKILFFGLFLFLIPIILLAVIFLPFKDKIFPNIFVAGVYLGDKTKPEAIETLKQSVSTPEKVTLLANGSVFEISTSEINLNFDFEKSVDRAFYYPKVLSLLYKPKNLGLFTNLDENKLNESLLIISGSVGDPPVYPTVEENNGKIIIQKGKNGVEVDIQKTKAELLKNVSLLKAGPVEIYLKNIDVELSQGEEIKITKRAQNLVNKNIDLSFEDHSFSIKSSTLLSFLNYENSYDTEQINKFIVDVSNTVNRGAQNSVFLVSNGKVTEFKPSIDGVAVNEKELLEKIKTALITLETSEENSQQIIIPVNISPAKIKNEDVNNLGINTRLGRGVSYFRGSIKNRIYNINHASSKFRGILVPPGETFSFNEILGDVSALTGYKSAYVIKDGKTVLGDGGGVCQVSTTMFRAVLNAGLPIVERRAHSYRVGYYEQGFPVGLDATIYHPTTDLKFVNNTPAHILIQSEIDIPHSTLVFEIYGTDDGRVATTTKPIITSSTAPPEDLYVDDPTLPTGTTKQIEYKSWGAKVVFDYTVTRNGETLTDKTFYSNYQPWQAVYLRGTAPTQ